MIESLPTWDRTLAITELLSRADDTRVSMSDRNAYLLAASNLVDGLDATTRHNFFLEAESLVGTVKPSEYDTFTSQFEHKLGALRVFSADSSTAASALYLAVCLADADDQRIGLKQIAYQLLGVSDRADYRVARALQRMGNAIDNDLGFLAGQSWSLRSLAAVRWVEHSEPEHLGQYLASDSDARVRHALADSLAGVFPTPAQADVRKILGEDPAYSVRSLLGKAQANQM